MINYLKHNDIDLQRWDTCVKTAQNGTVFALSWFLNAIHPSWEALVMEDYVAVMPLTHKKKFGLAYLCQPPFTQQLGVISLHKIDESLYKTFLDQIPKKFRLIEIRLNIGNLFPQQQQVLHRTQIIDISKPYEEILQHFHQNTRANIRRAARYDMVIDETVAPEVIVDLFRKNKGAQLHNLSNCDYEKMLQVTHEALKQKCAKVCAVRGEHGNVMAGIIFLLFRDKLILWFSGRDDEAKQKNAITFIINTMLRDNCVHYHVFDFEGSDDENLARFNNGFGSEAEYYPEYVSNRLPAFVRKILLLTKKTK